MKTTRQRLIEYLEAHPDSSSAVLSRALQVGPADIRYHLGELMREGQVRVTSRRNQSGRGRPAPLYHISNRGEPDSLSDLTSALLELAQPQDDQVAQRDFIRRVAEHLAGKLKTGEDPKRSLTARLLDAAQRLNQLHYQARWEARAGSPRVILGRCPYAGILADHPELCRMDALLLEKLLDAPVRQTAKLKREAGGGTVCIFEVGKQEA